MYASIRRYEGIDLDLVDEIIKRTKEGAVPIISGIEGFVAYYFLYGGDGVLATVSIFENQAQAEESNKTAASWVKENIAPLMPMNPPEITAGEVKAYKTA
jgi:dihydrodipicolinate synthase/N-acetylneuraminate lyase